MCSHALVLQQWWFMIYYPKCTLHKLPHDAGISGPMISCMCCVVPVGVGFHDTAVAVHTYVLTADSPWEFEFCIWILHLNYWSPNLYTSACRLIAMSWSGTTRCGNPSPFLSRRTAWWASTEDGIHSSTPRTALSLRQRRMQNLTGDWRDSTTT